MPKVIYVSPSGVEQAVEHHGAPIKGSVVTVPPAFTKDAVFEAIENGIELIVIVTERIPRGDVAQMVELASMRGSVQVLASEMNLSPDQLQLMSIVLRESERLNRIVSDFLTYARPPRSEPTTIELSALLSETVALLRNSPELRRDHFIREVYPRQPIHYLGDANQLKQIFWNLSRNAVTVGEADKLRRRLPLRADSNFTPWEIAQRRFLFEGDGE